MMTEHEATDRLPVHRNLHEEFVKSEEKLEDLVERPGTPEQAVFHKAEKKPSFLSRMWSMMWGKQTEKEADAADEKQEAAVGDVVAAQVD